MPLEIGNLGTRDEDILTSSGFRFFLFYLKLHDIRRMLDDFRDISIVARSNFTQDTLRNPDDTTNKPVPLSGDPVNTSSFEG